MFKLSDSVAQAKAILGQNVGDEARYTAARLTMFGNAALMRCAELYPDLFVTQEWMDLSDGVEQTVPAALSCRQIRTVVSFRQAGAEVAARPLDTSALAAWRPGWRVETAKLPNQAAPLPGRVDAFYCYPPADTSMEARVAFVKVPDTYAYTDDVPLPATLVPMLADYMAGMAEMADEEHVNSNRAAQLLDVFVKAVAQASGARA